MPNNENAPNEPRELGRNQESKELHIKQMAQLFLQRYYETFRVLYDKNGTLSCAYVVSPGVLQPIDDAFVINKMVLFLLGRVKPPEIKHSVFPSWRAMSASACGVDADTVVPLVFKSDTTTPWAFQRLDFDPEPIECPELLTKMMQRTTPNQARSLVLWLGSLLDYSFPRQQYLYLHGKGNDGKGTLIAMLVKLLGQQGVAMMNMETFADSHSTTALEGARLAIFADENSASFMSRGRFKALTGDDTMSINPKGMPRRNIRLHCKVLIASNHAPHVFGGRADMRRILPVHLAEIPATETSRREGLQFIEQGSTIMQFCYGAFRAWLAENPDTPTLPAAPEAMDEVEADSMQAETEAEVLSCLRFGPEYSVSAATLQTYLRSRFSGRGGLQPAYQVMKRLGAFRTQVTVNGVRTWMWSSVGIIPPT